MWLYLLVDCGSDGHVQIRVITLFQSTEQEDMNSDNKYRYLIEPASAYARRQPHPWILYEGGSLIFLSAKGEESDLVQVGAEQVDLYGVHLHAQQDLNNWRIEAISETGLVVHTAAADWKVFLHPDDLEDALDDRQIKELAQSMILLDWSDKEIIAASFVISRE